MQSDPGGVFGAASGFSVVEFDFDPLILFQKHARSCWIGVEVGSRSVSGEPMSADVASFSLRLIFHDGDGGVEDFEVARVEFGGPYLTSWSNEKSM